MPRKEFVTSGYTSMYMVVFFDLPVKLKIDRREYRLFRKALVKDGFQMLQYSVYSRYCASQHVVDQHLETVHNAVPPKGSVKILMLTSKMYERMESFYKGHREASEKEPDVFTFY